MTSTVAGADLKGPFVRLFSVYVNRYLRRHFHGVRLAKESPVPSREEGPLVVYFNHPSWWDPLLALVLARRFLLGRWHVGVIEAEAGERYSILKRLGIVGVDTASAAGARLFLKLAEDVLSRPDGVLWLTPQGRFVDARDRTIPFASGLSHLARRHPTARFVPLALEYPFWDERTPEALARFGEPLECLPSENRATVAKKLEQALVATQTSLAEDAMTRDPGRFLSLVEGSAGVGGIYDLLRRMRAAVTGRSFQAEHGNYASSTWREDAS